MILCFHHIKWFWLGVALEHLGVALCKSGVAPTTPLYIKLRMCV